MRQHLAPLFCLLVSNLMGIPHRIRLCIGKLVQALEFRQRFFQLEDLGSGNVLEYLYRR